MWGCGRAGISAHNGYGTKYWHWLVWSMGNRPRWGISTTVGVRREGGRLGEYADGASAEIACHFCLSLPSNSNSNNTKRKNKYRISTKIYLAPSLHLQLPPSPSSHVETHKSPFPRAVAAPPLINNCQKESSTQHSIPELPSCRKPHPHKSSPPSSPRGLESPTCSPP